MTKKEIILQAIDSTIKAGFTPSLQIFIKSVSRSGMSRKMVVHLQTIMNGEVYSLPITYQVNELLEQNPLNEYVSVKGCGMDMAFWLANHITIKLWPDKDERPDWLNGNACLKWQTIS